MKEQEISPFSFLQSISQSPFEGKEQSIKHAQIRPKSINGTTQINQCVVRYQNESKRAKAKNLSCVVNRLKIEKICLIVHYKL